MTSQVVESRVVEMIFDNSRFGENIQKALESLQKLDDKLKLTETIKGFQNLDDATKNFDLTAISNSVSTVSHKFSMLEIAGVTAIANIVNSAVDAGKRLVSSLSVDQVAAGWNKYADKTSAVQTIMAATAKDFNDTGKQMEFVNDQLTKLNWFTDETSYNFLDMVNNIGKFTSNNVDLETSVTAMQGISTWAAISGANVNEAGRAMYNLSQSLSMGSVKLMDWKSIELANMGTAEFKQTVIDTAAAMGELTKGSDGVFRTLKGNEVTIETFRDSLKDSWFTSEVLLKTLDKYGGFSDKLYEATEATGLYATDLLEALSDYKEGTLDMESIVAETGLSSKELTSIFKGLSDESFTLGERAFRAAQEAKTFQEAVDATKDAVSTAWMNTFEIIFGGYDKAKKLWTTVANEAYDIFAEPINARNEMLREALGDRRMTTEYWEDLREAGDATKAFRRELKKTAREHGIAVDEMIDEHGGFTKSLEEGWLTGTIFKETLDRISESELESEGYTKKEAEALKKLAKEAENADTPIGKIAESLSLTGRDLLFGSVRHVFDGIMEIAGVISEAFRDIFPKTTADQVYSFLIRLNDLTSKFKLTDEMADKLHRTFRGLFSVFDIFGQAIAAIARNFFPPFIKVAREAFSIFSDVSAKVGDWVYNLSRYTREFKVFDKVIASVKPTLVSFLDRVQKKIKFINVENIRKQLSLLSDILSGALSGGLNRISSISSRIGVFFKTITEFFSKTNLTKGFVNIVKALSGAVASLGKAVGNLAGKGIKSLFDALKSADYNTLFDVFNTILAAGLGTILVDFIRSLKNAFGTVIFNFKSVSSILLEVKGVLVSLQSELKAEVLMKIAKAVALLAGSMVALSLIDSEKLTKVLGAVSTLVAEMVGVMSVLDTVSSSYGSPNKKGLGGMIQSITGVFDSLGKRIKAGAIIEFGSAIMILAIALSVISAIDADRLNDSVVAISFLIGELAAAMSLMSFVSGTVGEDFSSSAKGFKSFAIAILIMSGALYLVSKIPQSDLENALMAITMMGAIITAMVGITTVAAGQYGKSLKKMGGSMIAASISILILAKALSDVAQIPAADLDRSLQTIETLGLVITAMGGVMAIMGKNGGSFSAGLGLIEAATALMILSKALSSIGDLKAEQFEQGMFGIGLALTGMAVALNAMKGTQSGALSLVIAAAALNLLVPPIKALGDLSVDQIAKALITLAGTFLTLSVAGTALAGLTPTLLGVSAAIVIFGLGIVAIGGGLTLIGTGLVTIAAGIAALGASLATGVGSIVFGIRTIILGVAGIIPDLVKVFGTALLAICQVIIESAPAIGEAFKALILTALDIISELVPQMIDVALSTLIEVLKQLTEHVPELVSLILTLITAVVDEVANHIPEIVQSVANLISEIFGAIFDELTKINSEEIQNAIFTVGLFAGMMVALAGLSAVAPSAMVGVIDLGAVIAELGIVLAAIGGLGQIPGLQWLVTEGGNFAQKIGTAVGQFIGGIVGGAIQGATSTLSSVGTALSNFMTSAEPFFNKIQSIDSSSFGNISSLATALLKLTAADLINGLSNFASVFTGHSTLSSFTDNLPELAAALTSYADNLGTSLNDKAKINSSKTLVEMLANLASGDIPKEGGLFQLIGGHSGLSSFYKGLPELGAALTSYADSLGDNLSGDKVDKSETLIKMLAGMASTEIPKTDGLVQLFAGESGLGKFAEQLPLLGASLTAYADSLGDSITSDKVTSSITAVRLLASLQDVVSGQNNGGILASGDLTQFGSNVEKLGSSISTFYSYVSPVDVGFLNSIITCISRIPPATIGLAEIDPSRISGLAVALAQLGDVTLDGFIDSMNRAASAASSAAGNIVNNFSSAMTGGGSQVKASAAYLASIAILGLSEKSASASNAGKSMALSISNGFRTTGSSEMAKSSTTIINVALREISGKASSFYNAGKNLASKLGSGVAGGQKNIAKSFSGPISRAVSSIRSYYSNFYSAGAYLVQGFTNGISANAYKAAAKAAAMAASTLRAAKKELKQNSPSKAFYEIGDYAVQGFANAFSDKSKNAYNAGRSLAEESVRGANTAIRLVNDLIQDGVNSAPTITPVIDITNVRAGVKTIGEMFNSQQALSTALNISGIQNNGRRSKDEQLAKQISGALTEAVHEIAKSQSDASDKTQYRLDVPLTIDGREVARATATFTRAELNRLDRNQNRREGIA